MTPPVQLDERLLDPDLDHFGAPARLRQTTNLNVAAQWLGDRATRPTRDGEPVATCRLRLICTGAALVVTPRRPSHKHPLNCCLSSAAECSGVWIDHELRGLIPHVWRHPPVDRHGPPPESGAIRSLNAGGGVRRSIIVLCSPPLTMIRRMKATSRVHHWFPGFEPTDHTMVVTHQQCRLVVSTLGGMPFQTPRPPVVMLGLPF